jgi:hypothetical protein
MDAIEICITAVNFYKDGHLQRVYDVHPNLNVDKLLYWLGSTPSSTLSDKRLLRAGLQSVAHTFFN